MNELTQKYISSREVAEMVEKEHKNLIRDIRNYIDLLTENTELNIEPSEYFKEDAYKDATGRTLICYLVSKKGCEFIAHKMTGQKGAIFTARYIEKFHEMEDLIQKPKSNAEMLLMFAQQMYDQEQRLATIEDDVKKLESKMITSPSEYYTVAGFANLRNIKLDVSRANIYGRKASKLSKTLGYEIGKVSDPRYGTVNTYHMDVLNEIL